MPSMIVMIIRMGIEETDFYCNFGDNVNLIWLHSLIIFLSLFLQFLCIYIYKLGSKSVY